MGYIRDEVIAAARTLEVQIAEISPSEVKQIRDRVADKYAGGKRNVNWLWEFMTESVSVNDPDGWTWVGEYVGDISEVIMFFCPADEEVGFVFPDGRSVQPVLENTVSDWEFYLTNKQLDFLLCWNHHEFLIACGEASRWLYKRYKDLTGEDDLVGQ